MNILKTNILPIMKWKTKKQTVLQYSFNPALNSCL